MAEDPARHGLEARRTGDVRLARDRSGRRRRRVEAHPVEGEELRRSGAGVARPGRGAHRFRDAGLIGGIRFSIQSRIRRRWLRMYQDMTNKAAPIVRPSPASTEAMIRTTATSTTPATTSSRAPTPA